MINGKGLWFLLVIGCCQCNGPAAYPPKVLVGEWRIDSIYQHVNGQGFTYDVPDPDWSTYQYHPGGRMAEKRYARQKMYRYQVIAPDSLVYTDSTGNFLSGFKILTLDERRLVLKKSRKPLLSGDNQHLYEIRFFSRVRPDSLGPRTRP